MKRLSSLLLATLTLIGVGILRGPAQGTAFTYQGRLTDGGNAATGIYDVRFALFDAETGGNQQGPILTNSRVSVNAGLFVTVLDFGQGLFTGSNYWLEVGVRSNGNDFFTTMVPRQPLTPNPYSIMANSASNLLGTLAAGQLSGRIPSAVISGTYSNAIILSNPGNSFGGNGSGLTDLNASQLTSGTVPRAALSNAWRGPFSAASTQPAFGNLNPNAVILGATKSSVNVTNPGTFYDGTGFILGGQDNHLDDMPLSGILGGYQNRIYPDDEDFSYQAGILFSWKSTNSSGGSVIVGGHENTIRNAANSVILGGGNNLMQRGDDALMFTSGSFLDGAAIMFGGGINVVGVAHNFGNNNNITNEFSVDPNAPAYVFAANTTVNGRGFFFGDRLTGIGSSNRSLAFGVSNTIAGDRVMAIGYNVTNTEAGTVAIGVGQLHSVFDTNGISITYDSSMPTERRGAIRITDVSGSSLQEAVVITNNLVGSRTFVLTSAGSIVMASGLDAGSSIKGFDLTGTNGVTIGTFNLTLLTGTANPQTAAYPNGSVYYQSNGPIWIRQNGIWLPAAGSVAETTLTESSATVVATVSIAAGKSCGIRVFATTRADDGNDFQEVSDTFTVSAVNKSGTITVGISTVTSANAASLGSLGTTWTAVANGNYVEIKNKAVSSLEQTTLKTKWRLEVDSSDSATTVAAH